MLRRTAKRTQCSSKSSSKSWPIQEAPFIQKVKVTLPLAQLSSMRRKRLTMSVESGSFTVSRSQPSKQQARKMRLCHHQSRLGNNPPNSAPRPPRKASSSPLNLKKPKEHQRKNLRKTINGLPSNEELRVADLRQPLRRQPPVRRLSARGRKERPSCASSRSRLMMLNKERQ